MTSEIAFGAPSWFVVHEGSKGCVCNGGTQDADVRMGSGELGVVAPVIPSHTRAHFLPAEWSKPQSGKRYFARDGLGRKEEMNLNQERERERM